MKRASEISKKKNSRKKSRCEKKSPEVGLERRLQRAIGSGLKKIGMII